ncbi:hypothetical protein SAMN05216186_1247 [Pseudomonas indica]|uniref:Uncharacterized protein n=1 Tax=Pseudomonas indica TaxID=137658 RepID=A0A1G9L5X9_9PSED|nr:hypothetical protein SAMN05216186_1247 [Pseudomonas indica]
MAASCSDNCGGARTEMALAVNAYNLKRAINVLGARRLIELLG